MQKNNNQFQEAIKYLMSFAAFLLPVFFLPITLEKFNFNKLSILIVLTGLSLILWTIDIIVNKEIKVAKTPFQVPGLLFIGAVLLSGIFSIDKTSSIFGAQGRWFPSIVSFAAFAVFYLVLTSNVKDRRDVKMILYSFLSGTTLSTLIGIISYYGLKIVPQAGPFFNPTGSLLSLGILAAIACAAGVYEILKSDSLGFKVAGGLVLLLNLFYIGLYNNPMIWVLTAFSIITVVLSSKVGELAYKKMETLGIGVIMVLVLGLTLTPLTRPAFVQTPFPQPVKLNFSESWDIAISAMRDFPLVGTGPSTFYLNYPRYRSIAMNRTDYWNLRFDKPFNEILLVVGTLGILGILMGTYLDFQIVKQSLVNLQKEDLNRLVSVLLLAVLASMFMASATVLTGFTLVLFLGLLGSLMNMEQEKYLNFSAEGSRRPNQGDESALSLVSATDENTAFLTIIMVLPLLAFAGLGFFTLYKIYPSEYYMQQAVDTLNTDAAQALEYQLNAIRMNPQRSRYYNNYAQTNLALAVNISRRENLTDTQREVIQNLISSAIRSTKINTEQINPVDPQNWEVRAAVYNAIRGAAQDADRWSRQAIETAINLDPNNPRLWVELGGFYFGQEDYLSAANAFRQATNLKPDYANAYYNFAQAVKGLEDYASAKRALELTLNLVPQDSPDYARVQEEIAELDQLLATRQTAQEESRPTIEELERQAEIEEAGEITEQEPLTVEGEEEEVIEELDQREAQQQEQEAETQEEPAAQEEPATQTE